MSLAALARRPFALLPAVGGALLMLGVLGANLRGAAAAVLAAAGAAVVNLRPGGQAAAVPAPLRILERVQLGPRQSLVLVETGGRRYLIATGATVTSLPPEEPG